MEKFLVVFLFSYFILIASSFALDLPASSDYVFNGGSFDAKVDIGNGASVSARVIIANIEVPRIRGGCASESELGQKSRDRLVGLLPKGAKIELSGISDDKYLGRINARVKLSDGRDVGEIMIGEKLAAAYGGGRRLSWCEK